MSRDYKHAEVFSSAAKPLPAWIWLFALLAVGSFVGLIYYLDQYEQENATVAPADVPEEATSSKKLTIPSPSGAEPQEKAGLAKNAEQGADEQSRFDFYKLLPKLRVDVPETDVVPDRAQLTTPLEDTSEQKTESIPVEKPRTPPEKTIPVFRYILQAGSFKDHREADRLKANLALMGIVARIEPVVLNRSDTWHRVRIGPIDSEREMNKIRNRLRGQSIEPIMLKVKA